ncbi:MAG: pilus assembly protein HicB [Mesorhizobium sp.]|nr:MAG: pilus assembly protein HicB [Mesorhizobium sp.]
MSKATYPLKLPLSVKEAAARLAKADGVSLNQWIASAVAQKVGAMETAADFLRQRARDASGEDFARILDRVAAGPPQAGDERPPKRH